jgi:A/G-specific adenine glycosylase
MIKPPCRAGALDDRPGFRDALVKWFRKEARDYPWRRTRDPYEILVSEVMLQQTQIATVLGKGYYTRFLWAFPDVATLAGASDEALLKAWEGLGYYRRARMLRDTARAVLADHAGVFPSQVDKLMNLPGIGRYTVGALRAFAFRKPAVLVDGNVSRVLSRIMDFSDAIDSTAGLKQIWSWAAELADDKRPAPYHAALMELGQRICKVGAPDCLACPVASFCKAREPESMPVKGRKSTITRVSEHALWIRDNEGRVLLERESGSRRTGLWKLPQRSVDEIGHLPLIAKSEYGITRLLVSLKVYDGRGQEMALKTSDSFAWVDEDKVVDLPMAAPFRRMLTHLMAEF